MRISEIKLENHPVLGNFEFSFLVDGGVKDFSLLIGENGAGKTILVDIIYDIIQGGIRLWNDEVNRKIGLYFSDKEQKELEIENEYLCFDYTYSKGPSWEQIKIFDKNGDDVTSRTRKIIQGDAPLNKLMKCLYSPVAINFELKDIDGPKSSDIDTDDAPKKKASGNLATQIAQLLVDIDTQDNKTIADLSKKNDGKIDLSTLDLKFDRFKNAYAKMFSGKELHEVRTEAGKQKIFIKYTSHDKEFDFSGLSSGEQQIVYRAGFLLSNLNTSEQGIVIIDEPELSLHPRWQQKYIEFLEELFIDETGKSKVQFIIVTHSPFLLKSALRPNVGIFVFTREDDGIKTRPFYENSSSLFDWGPTWGEICYHAYNMYTEEFHDDLYAALQDKNKYSRVTEFEDSYLKISSQVRQITWTDKSGNIQQETLMTWIRNKMHHRDNNNRPDYDEQDKIDSIHEMLRLINTP